ncbi:MAG: NUDIX domain-containing protein [Chlamydiota bacterium]|nr:NUDIX domain-containing protein [Chlamydiota bacterium]
MKDDELQHFIGKVSQKAIIINNDQILVCRGIGDSLWEFPGGRLHNEGTPQENLIREVKED